MSTIRTMEARMPPGFRFHPRDDELVLDYLLHKLAGTDCGVAMADVDLNKCEPWDLPEECCVTEGNVWYFFCLRDRKYTTGNRTNRATRSGYWKATGKDRAVVADEEKAAVGMRKTLVFYWGRAPNGRKTEWVMQKFRLEPWLLRQFPVRHQHDHLNNKDDWVLCRVSYKSRTSPTLRPPSEDQAYTLSCEPDLPTTAPPVEPVITTYNAFDSSRIAAEQASCFSGLPAVPFRRPVSLGDLLAIDTSEKEAMGIMVGTMSSGLELAPSWGQENELAQMWNPL